MNINSTGSLKELPIDAEDDDAWVEALMGQVKVNSPTSEKYINTPQGIEAGPTLNASS